MTQKISVRKIFNTKNPLIKVLMLEAKVQKPIETNPIAFFLQGAVEISYETRVAFHPVSLSFMERFNISIDTADFNKAVGHTCYIAVREGFEPMRLRKVDGKLLPQEPKKVPGLPFDVYLTKDDQPIYRTTLLEVNPTEFYDVLIQHDPLSPEIRMRIAEYRNSEKNQRTVAINNPNIMTEPELD